MRTSRERHQDIFTDPLWNIGFGDTEIMTPIRNPTSSLFRRLVNIDVFVLNKGRFLYRVVLRYDI